jgi:molybdopterin synthase catalytic subunit
MKVEVLFFAAARERTGLGTARLALPDGATVATAVEALVERWPALAALMPYVRIAVDEAFVFDQATALAEGATLALIPPVSGGHPRVSLLETPLEPRAVEALVTGPDRGGIVTFVGTVRDHTGALGVSRLEYEAYPSMAIKQMARILTEVEAEFVPVRCAIHHRLGILEIGEAAVVIATAAPHRGEAFAACQAIIDRLKQDVPIFKKEVRNDGSEWVGLGP